MNIIQQLTATLSQPIRDYVSANASSAAYMDKDTLSANKLKESGHFGSAEKAKLATTGLMQNHELTAEKVANGDLFLAELDKASLSEIKAVKIPKTLAYISTIAGNSYDSLQANEIYLAAEKQGSFEVNLAVIRDVFHNLSEDSRLNRLLIASFIFGHGPYEQEDQEQEQELEEGQASKKTRKKSNPNCSAKERDFLSTVLNLYFELLIDQSRAQHFSAARIAYERRLPEANFESVTELLLSSAERVIANNSSQPNNILRDQGVEHAANDLNVAIHKEHGKVVAWYGLQTVSAVGGMFFSAVPATLGASSNEFLEGVMSYLEDIAKPVSNRTNVSRLVS